MGMGIVSVGKERYTASYTDVPQYPWGIGLRTLLDTKVCRCSTLSFKMDAEHTNAQVRCVKHLAWCSAFSSTH